MFHICSHLRVTCLNICITCLKFIIYCNGMKISRFVTGTKLMSIQILPLCCWWQMRGPARRHQCVLCPRSSLWTRFTRTRHPDSDAWTTIITRILQSAGRQTAWWESVCEMKSLMCWNTSRRLSPMIQPMKEEKKKTAGGAEAVHSSNCPYDHVERRCWALADSCVWWWNVKQLNSGFVKWHHFLLSAPAAEWAEQTPPPPAVICCDLIITRI